MAAGIAAQDQNGDVNCDSNLNILDILYLIDHKYNQGPEPCELTPPEMPKVVSFKQSHIQNIVGQANQWVNFANITITAPTSGTIIINGQCVEYNWSNTTWNLGIDTSATGGSISYPSNSNPFELVDRFGENISEVVSVEADEYTFYYNMYSNDQPRTHEFFMVRLTATFYPNAEMP